MTNMIILPCAFVFWTWKSLAPVAVDIPSPAGTGRSEISADLSVLAFLEDQEDAEPAKLACNPFQGPTPTAQRNVSYVFNRDDTRQRADSNRTERTRDDRTYNNTDTTTPVNSRETVKVTYRGIFERTDGKIVALIEDSKSGKSAFYSVGDTVADLTIEDVHEDAIDVTLKDGSRVSLLMGKSKSF